MLVAMFVVEDKGWGLADDLRWWRVDGDEVEKREVV